MCSILGVLEIKSDLSTLREQALQMSRKMRHRGPDWSGIFDCDSAILAHERLAIVDLQSGAQPLYSADGNVVLAVNGEIYNHREIRERYEGRYEFQTSSDCEVILALYEEKGAELLEELNGIFAFVLYDKRNGRWLIGRDHIGICPLYTGRDEHGNLFVASEMKALVGVCRNLNEFPPGSYWQSDSDTPQKYYERDWMEFDNVEAVRDWLLGE